MAERRGPRGAERRRPIGEGREEGSARRGPRGEKGIERRG